jgi:hypothetical protein
LGAERCQPFVVRRYRRKTRRRTIKTTVAMITITTPYPIKKRTAFLEERFVAREDRNELEVSEPRQSAGFARSGEWF